MHANSSFHPITIQQLMLQSPLTNYLKTPNFLPVSHTPPPPISMNVATLPVDPYTLIPPRKLAKAQQTSSIISLSLSLIWQPPHLLPLPLTKTLPFPFPAGLDPAGPEFYNQPDSSRLDKTDADFVQIIHTNGCGFLDVRDLARLSNGWVDTWI